MRNNTNLLVDLRTNTELDAFYRGQYDWRHVQTVLSLVNPNQWFFDIGANVGFYTTAVAALIRTRNGSGHVAAFEPVTNNFERLVHNIGSNGLQRFCSLHAVALSNSSTNGVITVRENFSHGVHTGNAAIPTNEAFDAGFPRLPIRLERLDTLRDEILGDRGRIDVVKMDIEGHEDFCLEGGRETFSAHRPTILMEVNKPYYAARGVDLDERFPPLLPPRYAIFRYDRRRWRRIQSVTECLAVDNVFLVPDERLRLNNYRMFVS